MDTKKVVIRSKIGVGPAAEAMDLSMTLLRVKDSSRDNCKTPSKSAVDNPTSVCSLLLMSQTTKEKLPKTLRLHIDRRKVRPGVLRGISLKDAMSKEMVAESMFRTAR